MSEGVTPEALLAALLAAAGTRQKRSLQILHEVCLDYAASGGADFSKATIGRLSEAAGGVSAASLRNKRSAPFCQLIEAHAEKARRAATPVVAGHWTDAITDSKARERARLTEARLKKANRHIALQQTVLNESMAMKVQLVKGPGATREVIVQPKRRVSPAQRQVLLAGLSLARLQRLRCTEDAAGNIRDPHGRILISSEYRKLSGKAIAAYLDAD